MVLHFVSENGPGKRSVDKVPVKRLSLYPVIISVCCIHVQQIGHQPGMVANPPSGQLNREDKISPVPVLA